MAEAHQANALFLILHAVHEVASVATIGVDFFQHFQYRLVGATMQWAGQGVDATGDGYEHIGLCRTNHTYGRGGAVLLVVGVQD